MTLHEMFFGKPKPSPKFIPEVQRQRVFFSCPMRGVAFSLMNVRLVEKGKPLGGHVTFFEN